MQSAMLRVPASTAASALSAAASRSRRLQTSTWKLPIAPGGTLKVRLPTVCTLRVGAADPHADDGWNAASVALRVEPHDGNLPVTEAEAKRVTDGFGMSVAADYEPGKNFLLLETKRESANESISRLVHWARAWIGGPFKSDRLEYDSNVVVDVKLPGKFNLDVEVHDGVVELTDTFEGDVKIVSDYAEVCMNRVKGTYIDVEAGEGDVQAVVLQGNVSVRSTQGNIDIAKVQGPSFKLNTRDGDVQARAIYADYTSVTSLSGSVRMGGAQGNTKIRTTEGNVEVAGVEGRLVVETDAGDVEAQLSVPEAVSLRSRTGDIAISVPPALHAKVLLEAADPVDVDHTLVMDDRVPSGTKSDKGSKGQRAVRGWIGEPGGVLPETMSDEQTPRTIYARAPNGEISVNPGVWGGLSMRAPGRSESLRFPRWAAAFPPPSDLPGSQSSMSQQTAAVSQ